jgi:tartrate-resistant acid phosphatase type 5
MRRLFAPLLLALACSTAQPPPTSARAAQDGSLRFIAVGDTGMGNDGQRKVGAAMARTCAARGCDFVLLLGDNFYMSGVDGPDDPQWRTKFEEPYAALQMPFWAALGNHDYGNQGWGDDFARPEGELAYARRAGSRFRMPARRYRFTQGPVELFALDTNAERFGRDPTQRAEVADWISSSTARWKIAFGHHPYLSNGPHGNAGAYEPDAPKWRNKYEPRIAKGTSIKTLLDDAVCGKADLYLSGHDHNRQWLLPTCAGTELVVSGAGFETTPVGDRNPVRFQASKLGFLYLVVTPTELSGDFYDGDDQLEYSRVLRKDGP